MSKESVLFVCTHNSARSQMAESLLRDRFGDKYEVLSAGTEKTRVRSEAIEVMREIGVDLSGHRSKTVAEVAEGRSFDYVVTVCDSAREKCPYVPARRENLHHSFVDPSAASGDRSGRLALFRTVRDEIADWIEATFG